MHVDHKEIKILHGELLNYIKITLNIYFDGESCWELKYLHEMIVDGELHRNPLPFQTKTRQLEVGDVFTIPVNGKYCSEKH